MPSTRTLLPLALGAALAAAPARADDRTWTLCTPGNLRSCHSVTITTVPVMFGLVRIGTAVSVSLTNLEGSGLTNTTNTISGLSQVIFTAPVAVAIPLNVEFPTATMAGGATGALSWQVIATNTSTLVGTFAWVELRAFPSAAPDVLGGCTSGPILFPGTITANTCGTAATATFAFMLDGNIDASQLDNLFIAAYGASGSASCYSNLAGIPFTGQPCDMLVDPLVTPEPVTIALVGSGLIGIGLKRFRRRNNRTDL